ncbi:hypothetical protein B0T16DRAFT_492574 [Cercophora newfieldiana]|uniref:Uncharacterized protein n=1 Tax=Cercophora newfieldiana TaxID=92897 RepID=A0AA40CQ13_9PEZI|nr:hypothetical protein B0T16DRAFT_492574 [Cercophora newfieldiana]
MMIVTVALFLVALAWSAPLPESGIVTVSGPGVSDHGKPNLVCFPPSLMDIAIFVFVNYLTHAASSRFPAGASTRRTLKVVIDSLCYPILGVGYALDAIAQWSVGLTREFPWLVLPSDDLDTAHRAGALITACREHDWVPNPCDDGYDRVMVDKKDSEAEGDTPPLYTCRISNHPYYETGGREEAKRWLRFGQPNKHFNIFGGRDLPQGYGWVFIPWGVQIEPPKTKAPPNPPPPSRWALTRRRTDMKLLEVPLGADYSLFQPIAAVVQAISAGITLYRTRGDQLERYGFTSFGLTVVPYLVMSIVNFFAHFAVPKYSALYVVQSDILDEATRRLGDDVPRRCVVGRLSRGKPSKESPRIRIQEGSYDKGSERVAIDLVEFDTEPEKTGPEEGGPETPKPEVGGEAETGTATIDGKPSPTRGQMVIPSKKDKAKEVISVDTDQQQGGSKEDLHNQPEDKSKADPEVVVEEASADEEPNADDTEEASQPKHEIVVSRFPSVIRTDDKKPIGRKTIKVLHWAIGLSSLVIIAIISRMQLGTATKPRWKEIFIVWLVFSCLSAGATTMVFGVSGTILKGCLWIVKKVYHFLHDLFDGVFQKCLEWLGGGVKSGKRRLEAKAKESENRWWGYADDVIMFVLKFAFFFILLIMVSQQLVDYGDCTYFRT